MAEYEKAAAEKSGAAGGIPAGAARKVTLTTNSLVGGIFALILLIAFMTAGSSTHAQDEVAALGNVVSPAVYNIQVEPYLEESYAARITWQGSPRNDSPLVIGRSSQPIVDVEAVKSAYNVTPQFLHPNTGEFIDRNLTEGVYYYIVLSVAEIRMLDSANLSPGGNYSLRPFIVSRPVRFTKPRPEKQVEKQATDQPAKKPESRQPTPPPEEQPPPPQKAGQQKDDYRGVDSLLARYRAGQVFLSWAAPDFQEESDAKRQTNDFVYHIYRSAEKIESEQDLLEAELIGRQRGSKNSFRDQSPPKEKPVYYAVTVAHSTLEQELAGLKGGSSMIVYQPPTRAPVAKKPDPALESASKLARQKAELKPDYIVAAPGRSSVRVMFSFPQGAEGTSLDYDLYRSTEPIDSPAALKKAKRIARVTPSQSEHIDRALPSAYIEKGADLYYALVPATGDARKSPDYYLAERSYTARPAPLLARPQQKQPHEGVASRAQDQKDNQNNNDRGGEQASEKARLSKNGRNTSDDDGQVSVSAFRESKIRGLQARFKDGHVRLTWKVRGPVRGYHRFLVYRSPVPPQSLSRIQKQATLIADLKPNSWGHTDTSPGTGEVYYAVLLERQGMIDLIFHANENFTLQPVTIQETLEKRGPAMMSMISRHQVSQESPKKKLPHQVARSDAHSDLQSTDATAPMSRTEAADERALDEILARSFFQGQYASAARLLVAIEHNHAIPEQTRARARFFRAQALIHMGWYETASRLLRSPMVRKHHNREWMTWHNRIPVSHYRKTDRKTE